jgi:hypothetical protein
LYEPVGPNRKGEAMIDDLLTAAKAGVLDRLASPLLGSFSAAWCVWNYKFLVILFSDATVSQTFRLIETVAFPDAASIVGRGVVFPLLTALFYVFVYPHPARFVYEYSLQRQREANDVRRRIEAETLLTLEETRRFRAEFAKSERASQETVDRLNSEISRLKGNLERAVAEEGQVEGALILQSTPKANEKAVVPGPPEAPGAPEPTKAPQNLGQPTLQGKGLSDGRKAILERFAAAIGVQALNTMSLMDASNAMTRVAEKIALTGGGVDGLNAGALLGLRAAGLLDDANRATSLGTAYLVTCAREMAM